ncbi:MAG TPA: hypothetical protein VGD56_07015 [Gemmatirosa sp.]
MNTRDVRRSRHAPPGIALLEALVALLIVATSVTAGVALAAAATRAVDRVRERDAAVRRASAFLDAVALWPRTDLDRHLGDRPEGAWTLRVDRPAPTLYRVTLLSADSTPASLDGGPPMLSTSLYRPVDPPNAAGRVARP